MSALRKQIVPLLLIEVVLDSIEKNTIDLTVAQGHIDRVRRAVDAGHASLAAHYDIARLNVKPEIDRLQRIVGETWLLDTITTGEIVNACICVAADVAHQAPPSKKPAWEEIEGSLHELYLLIDPDLEDNPSIDRGVTVGEKFMEVVK